MIFGGIQKTSTIDFPGVLSCVVFVRRCDMNCFYCHNREIIAGSAGEFLPETEILAFLEKRQGLLDGVVVSGGELERGGAQEVYFCEFDGPAKRTVMVQIMGE